MSAVSPPSRQTPSSDTLNLPRSGERQPVGFVEFIALMTLLMALPALSIDIMLTALPRIGEEFLLTADNDRQLMITIYLLGFALGQPFYGPLSDRFGRRPLLFLGLGLYILATFIAVLAHHYHDLLLARGLQGFAAAAPRILAIAIVRDCAVGRAMSRIMSFIMMTFILVPIFAPGIGGVMEYWGGWRLIFWFLVLSAIVCIAWVAKRLPETRPAASRSSLHPRQLWQTLCAVLSNRQTVGYSIAVGFVYGCVMTYVGSAQQIFVDVYALGHAFPLAFGAVAAVMAASSITNAHLVHRYGMRHISHTGLIGFVVVGLMYLLCGFPAHPPLWVFYLYLAASFYLMCLCMPNFNALAMEPMGRMAGMGSAVMGFYTTAAGAGFGWLFGQAFDGNVRPLVMSFIVLGCLALASVLVIERGRFWQDPE